MKHAIRTESLSWREIDGEIVILDLQASKYLSLNGSGALIWRALTEGADDSAIVDRLSSHFEIDKQQAATDVAAFLDQCVELGLVR
jgi:hypothetical protein